MRATQPIARVTLESMGVCMCRNTYGAIKELTRVFKQASKDASFKKELRHCLETYVGRPTPLCLAERMTEELGTARIYLKREDLCHTGAHKINNAMGQILLAKRMGKKRIIAETGAGQHGVATATVCACLVLNVGFTWVALTWKDNHSMCFGCVAWVQRLFR